MLVALDHAIADAGLGEDILRLGRIFFDLAADVRHVDAEDLVVAPGARTPQLLDEIVVGQNLARVQAQQGHELIFVLRQLRVDARNVDAVLLTVKFCDYSEMLSVR